MQEAQFIKGMEILRAYISPTKIALKTSIALPTIHNYMNGMCPNIHKRRDIYTVAKKEFDEDKDKREQITAQLLKMGI
jgi:hypothetical protein